MAAKKPSTLSTLKPTGGLDLSDLVDLEERYGPIDEIDWGKLSVVRTIFWLILRHDEPELTEVEAGRRINAANLVAESRAILVRSGIRPQDDEETPQGNAVAPAGATSTGS